MRINNRFCGHLYGRPVLEDSTVYTSIRELRDDYMSAIEDFDKHELHTFPTVELDGEEYYAVRIFFDTEKEVQLSTLALSYPDVTVELCWYHSTTMYFLVQTEREENALLAAIADIFYGQED